MDAARRVVASLSPRWLWATSRWTLRCCLALTLALARRDVRGLRRDRIGRVIVAVAVAVAVVVAGDSRHTRFVDVEAVVDSRSLRLLAAALDSQRIGPAIAIVGSLWQAG